MAGLARMRTVVLDCPDPRSLAAFYQGLVGGEISARDDDWVNLDDTAEVHLSFERVDGYTPPTWPTGERPQHLHIDVTVDDVETAEAQVLALGARRHEVQPFEDVERPVASAGWRVYLDPVGHPFCLCWD